MKTEAFLAENNKTARRSNNRCFVTLIAFVVVAASAAFLHPNAVLAQSSFIPTVRPVSFAAHNQTVGKDSVRAPKLVSGFNLTPNVTGTAISAVRPVHLGRNIIAPGLFIPPVPRSVSLAVRPTTQVAEN